MCLQLALTHCAQFADMIWRILHPNGEHTVGTKSNPLDVVMYNDEVTPGNAMNPSNSRKFSAWYWSFIQIGRWVLMQEWAWLICGVFHSGNMKLIEGGLAWCLTTVLRLFFAPDGGALATTGATLVFGPGRSVRVFFRYRGLIADEEALHMCLGVKGSSGNRICLKCKNVLRKASGYADNDPYFVCQGCADPRLFDLATDEELFYAADTLAAAKPMASSGNFKLLEKAYGLHYIRTGPLYDLDLRPFFKPISGTRFDPCHVWFSNGIVQTELQCFFSSVQSELGPKTCTFSDLEAVCSSDWRFPGESDLQRSRTIASNMFASSKISAEGMPRLSASESLVAPHLVRFFVQRVVCALDGALVQRIQLQIDSVLAMCSAALAVPAAQTLNWFGQRLALRKYMYIYIYIYTSGTAAPCAQYTLSHSALRSVYTLHHSALRSVYTLHRSALRSVHLAAQRRALSAHRSG